MLTSKTTRGVIDKLKPFLARYRLPDRISTDNHSMKSQMYASLTLVKRNVNINIL